MKRNKVVFIVCLVFLFSFCVPCLAAQNISIKLDGQDTNIHGAVVNGRVLIPMRDIGEALGAVVIWDSSDRSVTIEKYLYRIGSSEQLDLSLKRIKMWINKTELRVDGIIVNPLDVSPQVIGGKTMVPLRVVSKWLGASVNWDPASQTVEITSGLNSNVEEARMKKMLLDAAEREAIRNTIDSFGTISEEPAVWISEYALNEKANIVLITGIDDFVNGFYKSGIAVSSEVLYVMDELPAGFKSEDGLKTYNNIRMKIENGIIYYNQEDLIKIGLISEALEVQYIIG